MIMKAEFRYNPHKGDGWKGCRFETWADDDGKSFVVKNRRGTNLAFGNFPHETEWIEVEESAKFAMQAFIDADGKDFWLGATWGTYKVESDSFSLGNCFVNRSETTYNDGLDPKGMRPEKIDFPLGSVSISQKAFEFCRKEQINYHTYFARHAKGDFGSCDAFKAERALLAYMFGKAIVSCYDVGPGQLWIVTEADRSSTRIMLPSEY